MKKLTLLASIVLLTATLSSCNNIGGNTWNYSNTPTQQNTNVKATTPSTTIIQKNTEATIKTTASEKVKTEWDKDVDAVLKTLLK